MPRGRRCVVACVAIVVVGYRAPFRHLNRTLSVPPVRCVGRWGLESPDLTGANLLSLHTRSESMQVKVKFLRQSGRATLTVDASELHEYLTALGVAKTPDGSKFADQPGYEYDTINTYNNRISTCLLLRTGVQVVNLGDHYRQPIGIDTLNTLADSVGEVVRAVVDHYRPIEISVVISGKKAA